MNTLFPLHTLSDAIFDDPRIAIHHRLLHSQQHWITRLHWDEAIELPSTARDALWFMASQSTYAEQTGLVSASFLACESPDSITRLTYTTASVDEAIHVEAFSRLAARLGRGIAPPEPHFLRLHRTALDRSLPHFVRLVIHTLLEGWATDEFSLLARHFGTSLIGRVYAHVASDETRHVQIGIHSIRAYIDQTGEDGLRLLRDAERIAYDASGITDETWNCLSVLCELPGEEVMQWFNDRHARRIFALTGTSKGETYASA